ncbi:hypothetical protein B484DRAFT_454991 [Ochromonadaceae sp. CCMP2298]|nr:hypothetical protein B484DRAFT_454991 [Ochromonadaceae sp. CCMP2298]|mmetsp:Transcript_18006/g.39919  ORF Transcript_18006/g.39919 Transcript_18006/m.39919 type:complete len:803 (+) Transcript_18006:458-2866(+)
MWGNLAANALNVLNSLDNAAKDTLEEPRLSATALRSKRRGEHGRAGDRTEEEDEDAEEVDVEAEKREERSSPFDEDQALTASDEPDWEKTSNVRDTSSADEASGNGDYSLHGEQEQEQQQERQQERQGQAAKPVLGNPRPIKTPVSSPKSGPRAQSIASAATTTTASASAAAASATAPAPAPASSPAIAPAYAPTSTTAPTPAHTSAVSVPRTPLRATVEVGAATPTVGTGTGARDSPGTGRLWSPTGTETETAEKGEKGGRAERVKGVKEKGEKGEMGERGDRGEDKDRADKEVLKKALRRKNQEIEKLNRECLDLEEQVGALKGEVQEAWDNYKTAQEKAAAVEGELLEEVGLVQKAKATDKQASQASLAKMGEELTEASNLLAAVTAQREEIQSNLAFVTEENSKWEGRLEAAARELQEARQGTAVGAHVLREQLQTAQERVEQMRVDQASLLRQHQQQREALERENAELCASLAQQQREIARLGAQSSLNEGLGASASAGAGDRGVGGSGSDLYVNRDYVSLQQELQQVSGRLEESQDRAEEAERRARLLEREARAAQLSLEDERARHAEQEARLGGSGAGSGGSGATISSQSDVGVREGESFLFSAGEGGDGAGAGEGAGGKEAGASGAEGREYTESLLRELQEHRAQSQSLSKLLLKKQGSVLELQAERSALKSRLIDAQARLAAAEQATTRDLEEGEGGGEERDGLSKRGRKDAKVISDLERMGVKPGARVAKAVNMLDSWTLISGRFLRAYPLARLGFVFYLLLLHLWQLAILVIHAHSLELESGPGDPRQQLP